MVIRCTSLTKSGHPCACPALKGEYLCLFHSKSEKAAEIRKRAHNPGTFISRRELLKTLSRDFRELASRTDEASRKERQRLASLLHELTSEVQQLSKIKRLAKEKGLL
jgi:hypothetical protein